MKLDLEVRLTSNVNYLERFLDLMQFIEQNLQEIVNAIGVLNRD